MYFILQGHDHSMISERYKILHCGSEKMLLIFFSIFIYKPLNEYNTGIASLARWIFIPEISERPLLCARRWAKQSSKCPVQV